MEVDENNNNSKNDEMEVNKNDVMEMEGDNDENMNINVDFDGYGDHPSTRVCDFRETDDEILSRGSTPKVKKSTQY